MTERTQCGSVAAGPSRVCRRLLALCAASIWLILTGCASVSVVDDSVVGRPAEAGPPNDSLSWNYVRFRLAPEDDGTVNSYLDLMLADQVLAPVIDRYGADIPLWRFHRRWPKDQTGHQFSFIFYASPDVVGAVTAQIRRNPLLQTLGEQGYLVEYRVDEGGTADVAATSDPGWPETIQREWPAFIMGASRMWLGLLQTEASLHDSMELYARFRMTEKTLDDLWFNEGNHAFFHHLSALFGYKPLRVIRRDVMTF